MLARIALFEIRYQLKRPLLWLVLSFFFAMAFGATASDQVRIGGAIGNVYRNSPWVILQFHLVLSIVSMFITTVFAASAILRDFELQTSEMFFSRPISRFDYLAGRFVAGFLISLFAFSGSSLGMIAGSFAPWLDPQQLGPFMPQAYLWGFVVFAAPNILFTAALFFSAAGLTRNMLYTYLAVVGFLVAYSIAGFLLIDIDNRWIGSYLDPFGGAALTEITRYWTVVERNTLLPPLSGLLLINRLIWIIGSLLILNTTYALFRTSQHTSRRTKKNSVPQPLEAHSLVLAGVGPLPKVIRDFSTKAAIKQFFHQIRVEVGGVIKSVPFPIILFFGLLNLGTSVALRNTLYGTSVYPVTHLMLTAIQGSFLFLLFIVITFYSGELVWRERSVKMSEVTDTTPAPNWVFYGAKITAQISVVLAFLALGVITTIIAQLILGYNQIELMVYLKGFVVMVFPFVVTCFLASFLQVISGQKFIGYLFMVIFIISSIVLAAFNLEHNLYSFAGVPDAPYSDMNGYGHFVAPLFWFNLYWSLAAAVLAGLTALFWQRGTDTSLATRFKLAKARFSGPVRVFVPTMAACFVLVGAFIFYNTNFLNHYIPGDEARDMQATYEKNYRKYVDAPLPRVKDVYADVDIFPDERRVEIRGRYKTVNTNPAPMQEIHLTIPRDVTVNKLDFPAHTEVQNDKDYGYRIYKLDKPLQVGEEMTISFDLSVINRGFRNSSSNTLIVENGTFFNNREYFIGFGYDQSQELQEANQRRRHGLPPVHRMAKVDDLFARRNTEFLNDSDWINFETVVSTSADQIAIAPGYLQKEWMQNGRHYFHYKMDSPMLHFFSYLSARYEVVRDKWNDVAIEIYYHKPHTYNVKRMIDGIKKSLDYYTTQYGPYQHRQARIIEFPRYQVFAQSFPNTIPYSEDIGFIAKLDKDPDAIDYTFYITAHEMAHQWWAHQVVGGNVQGASMLTEALSQYSALMVMEKEYGIDKMRRFLKYELDLYLSGRGRELIEEMPLAQVEAQPYIYYRKGSVVTYALRDYLGEDHFNRALKKFVAAHKFQMPPYTNSQEFIDNLRGEIPADKSALITDMLEKITLFENRVEEATWAPRADGTYVVTIEAKAKKLIADGKGVEKEIPIDDWIDIGVFGEVEKAGKTEPTVLYLQKHHITGNTVKLEVVVDKAPVRAGIDPFNKLIDRDSNDNLKKVKLTNGKVAAIKTSP